MHGCGKVSKYGNKKFYVTASIAYERAAAYRACDGACAGGCACAVSPLTRRRRFFLTGTDEHGKKIAEAAAKAHMDVQVFVDSVSARFSELCRALGISYDNFIRTSDKKHILFVERIWKHMEESGDIYKGEYEGDIARGVKRFLREAEMDNGVCLIHKERNTSGA